MIEFVNVTKSYKYTEVLHNINLQVNEGQIVVCIGESGCGKTTLLKMINRLIRPNNGAILYKGQDISTMDVIALRRKIGYVIQQTGLFPHMTVRENIEIIPKAEKLPKETVIAKVDNLMQMVGLDIDEYANRYPNQLSGGQQQRIGVARALANDPDLILMDEPFSALDPITRSDLQDQLIELQSKMKKTVIFVTHDMDEAIKIADKICIMKDGCIIQYDTPENILKNPLDDFVSGFVGKNRIWSSPEYIKVKDIMLENPITAANHLSVLACMEKMRQNKVDSLMIIDTISRKLLGVVTAKQLRNLKDRSLLAEAVMYTNYQFLDPEQTILDALRIVNEQRGSTIPVVNEQGILLGLITKSSLVTTLSHQYLEVE